MELFYYNQLGKPEQKAYMHMKEGICNLEWEFDVTRLDGVQLSDIFYRLRLDCPEIFYVSGFKYSFYPESNMVHMKPDYLFDKNKIKDHKAALKSRIDKLCRKAENMSDWDKEVYIHDFICENVKYDKLKKQYSHEILGPLGQGVGVCEGIAKSVKILCDNLSIPCIVVISENNPEKGIKYRHGWNLVKINGKWFHLDATFDNTLSKNVLRYDYFNLCDKSIYRDHESSIYMIPESVEKEFSYCRVKKLSFSKLSDVENRCKQAAKKGKCFTFCWHGGFFTREVCKEILNIIEKAAKEKSRHSLVSINFQQAVVSVDFSEKVSLDTVVMENAYEEENEELE